MASDLHAVTGLWPVKNDVPEVDEAKFRKLGGAASISHGELMQLCHHVLVTGRGKFAPADMSTECYISNTSVRSLRSKTGQIGPVGAVKNSSLHTRLGFYNIKYINTHHATYALFKSRSALMFMLKKRGEDGKAIAKEKPLLHCSHRCHVDACVNPRHLTLDSADINRKRSVCKGNGSCSTDRHSGEVCLFYGTAWETAFRLVHKQASRGIWTLEKRLKTIRNQEKARKRRNGQNAFDRLRTQWVNLLNNPATCEEALRTIAHGVSARETLGDLPQDQHPN